MENLHQAKSRSKSECQVFFNVINLNGDAPALKQSGFVFAFCLGWNRSLSFLQFFLHLNIVHCFVKCFCTRCKIAISSQNEYIASRNENDFRLRGTKLFVGLDEWIPPSILHEIRSLIPILRQLVNLHHVPSVKHLHQPFVSFDQKMASFYF